MLVAEEVGRDRSGWTIGRFAYGFAVGQLSIGGSAGMTCDSIVALG